MEFSNDNSEIRTEKYCLIPITRNRYKISVTCFQFKKEHAIQIPRCYFSGPQQSWVMPAEHSIIKRFLEVIDKETKSVAKSEVEKTLNNIENHLILCRYSKNTIKTYMEQIRRFFTYFRNNTPAKLTDENVKEYLLHLLNNKDISISYQKQVICSIKFYFEKILGREKKNYFFDYTVKQERKLPVVLTKWELKKFFEKIEDIKNMAIFKTIYSSGIRISELINLRISDIDSEMMLINIRSGKGMKDRVTLLSTELLTLIREYYKKYRPKVWLFESTEGVKYTPQAIRKKFHLAFNKTGIDKKATVHTLRHTFATHMLENGEDVRKIQKLLGHKNISTTEIYTHISSQAIKNLKSPLDSLITEKEKKK